MEFAVTFQSKYHREEHPVIPEVTGRSYMIVEAEDEYEAREKLHRHIGGDWSFIYPYDKSFVEQIEQYELVEVDPPWAS